MPKGRGKNYYVLAVLALVAFGVILAVLNAPADAGPIAQERTIDQRSDMFFTYTTVRYPAKVEVLTPTVSTENLTIGFNTNTNELDFGKVEAGGAVKKYLNLSTLDGKPSKIILRSRGTINPLLKFDRDEFLFNGNASIGVAMNSGSFPGNYTGEVAVVIQRSKTGILTQLLGF